MITKYRSPGRRSWGGDKVEEFKFERETEKCLFDSRGNKTLKVQDWAVYHDTREQAQAHLDSLNAERNRRISEERIRNAAPALLEALEDALKTAEFENHPFRSWHEKARAAIAAAKGE